MSGQTGNENTTDIFSPRGRESVVGFITRVAIGQRLRVYMDYYNQLSSHFETHLAVFLVKHRLVDLAVVYGMPSMSLLNEKSDIPMMMTQGKVA